MLQAGYSRTLAATTAIGLALAAATGISYAHPLGKTTEQQQIDRGSSLGAGFFALNETAGSRRIVRQLTGASALAGRENRRRSLTYFAQMTDFQLADEEAPARVEFLDRDPSGTASSAWRPQEGFHPWVIDYSMRQLNRFTAASPHRQGNGSRARMDLGLMTGDLSDNQQRNETIWVRKLVEGGQPLTPNSGTANFAATTCTPLDQAALAAKYPDLADEAAGYTGVQDYDDYAGSTDYYDPDEPAGDFAGWRRYAGLMDRAQKALAPVGLRRGSAPVPTYFANGNHDGLVQGNEDATFAYEALNVGCFKPFVGSPNFTGLLDPGQALSATTGFFVPPDYERRFVDRVELKKIYRAGIQADDHGLAFIDRSENVASGFAATYYAWDPKPGLRFIGIDTVSDGGTVADSSSGNIDDPQWRWLQRELNAAKSAGKRVVLFGHHPIRSLDAVTADERASPCTGRYTSPTGTDANAVYNGTVTRGHDPNPGCDLDPRTSTPLHHGEDLVQLLGGYRNVIAYAAGHTHENKILACGLEAGCAASGGNWWEINTAAGSADWPQQNRLVEVMDNGDGTLSLLGTTLDHGSSVAIPPATDDTAAFNGETLASLGRVFSYNDPHADKASPPSTPFGAEGAPKDRNVELLVDDPLTRRIIGTPGDDVLIGTPGNDIIICGAGNDIVRAGAGDDIIRCGPGNDFVDGGDGNDRISGDSGNDRLLGGRGNDRIRGRSGNDRISGQSGRDRALGGSGRDRVNGGSGRDRVAGNSGRDRLSGGGSRDRIKGGAGNDRLFGRSGNDRLFGQSGRDRLRGNAGRDRLYGGKGRDVLIGGPGRDRLRGGPGVDRRTQ